MILIALGANLPSLAGPPAQTLAAALSSLENRNIKIRAVSSFYGTPAWPDPSDPPFINAVAALETGFEPNALMKILHEVETEFGRKRSVPNAPRTLDIDLIDYQGRIIPGDPQLPHPRAASRAFVLVPLREIAPLWRDPVSGQSVDELLAGLPDVAMVRRREA
jgi:2-amino-4-hydroxy-6-hydroxymethyldihydropteridine diphosphokinase